MTPRDFCNWLQGALSMATAEDGSVSFTELQANKVKALLVESLRDPAAPTTHQSGPSVVRC